MTIIFSLLWWISEWNGFLNDEKCKAALDFVYQELIGMFNHCDLIVLPSHVRDRFLHWRVYCPSRWSTHHQRRDKTSVCGGGKLFWIKFTGVLYTGVTVYCSGYICSHPPCSSSMACSHRRSGIPDIFLLMFSAERCFLCPKLLYLCPFLCP